MANPVDESLKNLHNFCLSNSFDYVIIGGLAVIAYGVNRTTQDIDVSLVIELEDIAGTAKIITAFYKPIFDKPLEFFEQNFVLPAIDKKTGLKIDFTAGLTEFDRQIITRRKLKKFSSIEFYIPSIEDLLLTKLFANRNQDLSDAELIMEMYLHSMDQQYLRKMFEEFEELGRTDIADIFHLIKSRISK